ncbi:RDD family protein [Micromonospora sp. WMMD712]|uniref:RDD family protein n=1 Tax=Micromonospora sp. WMMD712 TaxID=3016096 RepID=UPI00249A3252|nr:RDD family protein [Micromonospora sp. WMMD712]WFE58336.1 RDD family protein [Micromonospora sp. WMMD712]
MTQLPTYPTPPAGGQPPAGYPPPAGWVPPRPGYPPPAGWRPPPRPGFAPTPVGPGGQPLASFGDRLLAFLIDSAVAGLLVVTLFLPVMMYVWFVVVDDFTRTDPADQFLATHPKSFLTDFVLPLFLAELGLVVLMLGLYWLYHVEYLCRSGQTLGKKVMKLRVVPLDPARTLDRAMAGRRYLVQFVAATVVPGFSYLDGFWQLGDKPWQQCLHDKFAGTVVVKVAP